MPVSIPDKFTLQEKRVSENISNLMAFHNDRTRATAHPHFLATATSSFWQLCLERANSSHCIFATWFPSPWEAGAGPGLLSIPTRRQPEVCGSG